MQVFKKDGRPERIARTPVDVVQLRHEGYVESAAEVAEPTEPEMPHDFTVTEVNAYLDANPNEVERVLALEARGQARKGILDGPHASA